MPFKKRVLPVVIAALMVITMMPANVQAASTANVYMKVTQDNAKAKQILKYVNKERTKRGLKKLKLDKSLTNAAVQRAAEVSILVPTTTPHKRPNGKIAKTVNKKISYECCLESEGWTPKKMVKSWMTSKSHKKGILLRSAKSIGISYVTTVDGYQIATLEISKSKAKSIMKSSSKKAVTKKVAAKKTLLKKGYFKIRNASTMTAGAKSTAKVIYSGPKAYGPGLVAAKSFKWSSSNSGVAAVSSSGAITAKKAGTVTIKAKLKTGSKFTITKKITVKSKTNGSGAGTQTETYEQKVLKNRQKLFDWTKSNGTQGETSAGTVYYATNEQYGTSGTSDRFVYMFAYPATNELRLVYKLSETDEDDPTNNIEHTAQIALYTNKVNDPWCRVIVREGDESDTDSYLYFQITGTVDRETYKADDNENTVTFDDPSIYWGEDLLLGDEECEFIAFNRLQEGARRWDTWLTEWTGITGISMYSLGFPAMGS